MKLIVKTNQDQAVSAATNRLKACLRDGGSLFISGGSSYKVFAELDQQLTDEEKSGISIYQADERYGPPGHQDSNWSLASQVNFIKYQTAVPVLTEGMSAEAEAKLYEVMLEGLLQQDSQRTVALLGMGEDSHTAGVKPMTKVQFANIFGTKLVADYKWTDFHRLTLTLLALEKLDSVVVYAEGESKRAAISELEADHPKHSSPIHGLLGHEDITIFYSEE